MRKTLFLLITLTVLFIPKAFAWKGIVVHWSDSPKMTLEQCNEWHNERGWNGCGYNFLIQRSGQVDEARGPYRAGAHVRGHNEEFLGICFIGDSAPTKEQLLAFVKLKFQLERIFGPLPVITHSDLAKTLCPGPMLTKLIHQKFWLTEEV